MVFLSPQGQHELIPQAHAPAATVTLVSQIKDFRDGMFQLFQQKIAAATAPLSDTADPDPHYLQIRQELDRSPDIVAAHQQRGEWQDRLWARALEEIAADRDRLEAVYATHQPDSGDLELNPELAMPLHQRKADIHRMPGGYLSDAADPLATGLLYDHGTFLYGRGWFGPLNDELGHTLIHQVLAAYYPDRQPQTILDMGCAVGHSTLPYATVFPEAQVTGIDLGAALLRYGAARAQVLGQPVRFAQQNAEQTDFADQSFDLVVSHILFHEIPGIARQRVLAESYRLLKPGGVMVHLDSQLFLNPTNLVARYFRDTEVWANSEPYLGSSKFADFSRYALQAGFAPEAFQVRLVPGHTAAQQGDRTPRWVAFCGEKR
jgi:SAM-dependent methyltransferase